MKEANLQRLIQAAAAEHGHRLFRNNIGTLPDARGIPVHFGLAKGSGDLIGWTRAGRFASIEVKVGNNRPSEAQIRWRDAVCASGGVGAVVRSVEEALEALDADR